MRAGRRGSGDVPYMNHPAEVADLVAMAGAPPDVVVAAFLHDLVEDTNLSSQDIAQEFGPGVAHLVEALTNPPEWDDLPKLEMKTLQAEHVRNASPDAKIIKIADQTSNLNDIARDPAAWDPERARDYIEGSRRVVDACRGASAWLDECFDAAEREARAGLAQTFGEVLKRLPQRPPFALAGTAGLRHLLLQRSIRRRSKKMTQHATPFDLWKGSVEIGQMLFETQMVVTYRMLGLAGFWAVGKTENRRMIAEKAPAFLEASVAATQAAVRGERPDQVVGAWVKPLRRKTSQNARRLGRLGPRVG